MKSSLARIGADSYVPPLQEHHLPFPHIIYGLIAFCVFLALLGLLWSFRNTATKAAASTAGNDHGGRSEH